MREEMNAMRQGKKAPSDKKCSLLVLLNEAFLRNSSTWVSRVDRGVGSGLSYAAAGGVTVSMMNRLISKTGLQRRMAR